MEGWISKNMRKDIPIVELKGVNKTFGGVVQALSVSIGIYKNEVVGVVGKMVQENPP